ncbi:MAG: hypothetical protein IPL40_08230 [Proteobacteria bacterium]|nr:hypothetical protein [Pseudomonadota bacterium]
MAYPRWLRQVRVVCGLAGCVGLGCQDASTTSPATGSDRDRPADASSAVARSPVAGDPDTPGPRPSIDAALPWRAPAPAISGNLVFAASAEPCDASCRQTRFSYEVPELHVSTLWKGLSGRHFEYRRFYGPDGNPVLEQLVTFDTTLTEPAPLAGPALGPNATAVLPAPLNNAGEAVVRHWVMVRGTGQGMHYPGVYRVEVLRDKLSGAPDLVGSYTLTASP